MGKLMIQLINTRNKKRVQKGGESYKGTFKFEKNTVQQKYELK